MHLSLLSDATVSDLLDDSGRREPAGNGAARQHFNGLVRGLIFAAALLTPFALTFAPSAFGHSHASSHVAETRP